MGNELTQEDYVRINTYYRLVPHPDLPNDNTQQCIEMTTGPFKRVMCKYGKFQATCMNIDADDIYLFFTRRIFLGALKGRYVS